MGEINTDTDKPPDGKYDRDKSEFIKGISRFS